MRMPFVRARRGFTVIEMMLTGFLMGLLAVLLGNAWAAFGRPAISSVARCRVAQEANLAAEALARDLGMLAQDLIGPPTPTTSRYLNASPQSDGSPLSFFIDDGTSFHTDGTHATRHIVYSFDPTTTHLVRTDYSTDPPTRRVVATLVSDFQAKHCNLDGTGAPGVQVDMTFSHPAYDRVNGVFQPDYTRRFSLFIPDP
jgi:hypothetical protein